ncbi:peptidase [Limosilactobacillus sp. Sa3CUN2]|uniref:Peptidase n=1 Tax=Limosilactobacillus avistercoris TaxID=2762243 RepID=A0ABR8PC75_9LACO|nr:VWA-like domain-containing protein [Limosilactobacillus avistercoris]MBD7894841.1 peptidase [Limosilactobacillus avistercoris]
MNQLVKMLEQLRRNPQDSELAQRVLTQAIIQILQSQRVLGEVLLQIPRQIVSYQNPKAVVGLFWRKDQIELRVASDKLADLRSDEVVILLEHEALHLLWQHPLRYANSPTPELVQLATDIAVNQYLPEVPRETMTLAQLQRCLHRQISPYQDSSVYLRLLQSLPEKDKRKLRKLGEREIQQAANDKLTKTYQETHQGWQLGSSQLNPGNQQLRLAQLKKILRQAWQNTPKKDRGLLPGDVMEPLTEPKSKSQFKWQQLVSRQLGTIAAGREEVAYRFNRRQPWRMELPGTVSRLVLRILVFVDNSGSVTDEELAKVLSQISFLANSDQLPLEIYPFDARIHSEQRQKIANGRRVKFQRIGGGGTSFQCIFDFLYAQNVNPTNSLVLIMTDGWGEESVNTYNFRHVDWLLTGATTDLSIHHPVGRIFSLKKGTE